jgi:hypothetical protein
MSALDNKDLKSAAMSRVRVVEAALRSWDPIGVMDLEEPPLDEYDSYAPLIVAMVERGCTPEELARHLGHIQSTAMGLGPSPENDRKIAVQICESLRPSDKSLERTRER